MLKLHKNAARNQLIEIWKANAKYKIELNLIANCRSNEH
jgi:hypothetical protein